MQCEYIASHRISNGFVNKKVVNLYSENVALPAKSVISLQLNIIFKNALSLLAFIWVDLPLCTIVQCYASALY